MTNDDRENLAEELDELQRAHYENQERYRSLSDQLDNVQAAIAHDTIDILQLEHNIHPGELI